MNRHTGTTETKKMTISRRPQTCQHAVADIVYIAGIVGMTGIAEMFDWFQVWHLICNGEFPTLGPECEIVVFETTCSHAFEAFLRTKGSGFFQTMLHQAPSSVVSVYLQGPPFGRKQHAVHWTRDIPDEATVEDRREHRFARGKWKAMEVEFKVA